MKLKEIPQNTVVHTPTEAEARELLAILHENGYKWGFCSESLINLSHWNQYETAMGYFIDANDNIIQYGDMDDRDNLDGYSILTLAEFKERYVLNEDNFIKSEEKPQPKFNKGDKVVIQESYYKEELHGQIGVVTGRPTPFSYYVEIDNTIYQASAKDLEPYTEPETKPTEEREAKGKESGETGNNSEISQSNNLSQDIANCDKPEDKQLNLCELLQGYEGDTFWSPVFGDIKLSRIDTDDNKPLLFEWEEGSIYTYPDGKMYSGTLPIVFPSRALYEQYPLDPYTAWMKWQEEQTQYKVHLMLDAKPECPFSSEADSYEFAFRTPEDRDKCIEEIKAIINKYSK